MFNSPFSLCYSTDIDECVKKNPCKDGSCINTPGNYTCDCGKYAKGDGKTEQCMQKFPYVARVATCKYSFRFQKLRKKELELRTLLPSISNFKGWYLFNNI